jgi:hypothetical protein
MKTTTKLLCALALFTATQLSAQVVPEYLNYQGLLKAADGSPLATGNYTMEFNIYDKANPGGDTKIWGPFLFDGNAGAGHGLVVPVVNGSFNVIIGPKDTGGASITNAFTAPTRFIEIKVNGGAAILPRQQFLSTAYALQSQKAQLADVAASLVKELADALCPPGSIMAFGGDTNHIPSGWLLCDGCPLTNTMYANLFNAIGTNWGNGTLDSSGTAENPPNAATGFNLPDLRGMFLRGVNGSLANATWKDPDADNRISRYAGNTGNLVGSVQPNELKLHNHQNSPFIYLLKVDGKDTSQYVDNVGETQPNLVVAGEIQPSGGTETRPNNAYVNYIIKY